MKVYRVCKNICSLSNIWLCLEMLMTRMFAVEDEKKRDIYKELWSTKGNLHFYKRHYSRSFWKKSYTRTNGEVLETFEMTKNEHRKQLSLKCMKTYPPVSVKLIFFCSKLNKFKNTFDITPAFIKISLADAIQAPDWSWSTFFIRPLGDRDHL